MSALHKFMLHETAHRFNVKWIKIRQAAPSHCHWNQHKIVTKFRLQSAFASASACLALKIDYVIYSSENPVTIYPSAQCNISEDLST